MVRMESRTFPDPLFWDSNYTACLAASDGQVYVGLNYHGKGATVAVYDPRTDTMKTLGDMNVIAGQPNVWVEPQSKVHTQIVEGADGSIYFGTHLSAFFNFAKFTSGEAYPGGHWMVYDPRADRVRDLGIARKGNGLLTMTMDPERNRLSTRSPIRKGTSSITTSTRAGRPIWGGFRTGTLSDALLPWMTWGAFTDRGVMDGCGAYDPETDTIENLLVQLPQREVGVPIHRAYWETEQTFTAVAHSDDHKLIYFLETGSSNLVEYDPHDGPEGSMRFLAQLSADRYLGKRDVPYAMISFTRGADNVIYYAANSAVGDEEGNPYWGGGMSAGLVTYDLNTGERQDRGLIRTQDDRVVVHPNAASAAPDGTIYFVAHVLEPDAEGRGMSNLPADLVLEKEPEHKKQLYERSYTMRLLIYRPQTRDR